MSGKRKGPNKKGEQQTGPMTPLRWIGLIVVFIFISPWGIYVYYYNDLYYCLKMSAILRTGVIISPNIMAL